MTGKRFAKKRDRPGLRLVVALVAGAIVMSDWTAAQAFDFFGLWGSDDTPPPVSPASIPYTRDRRGRGRRQRAQERGRGTPRRSTGCARTPPPDGDALARRAQGDFAPIIDALWGAGYYDATVTIAIDRASLSIGSSDIAAFARAAEAIAIAPSRPVVDQGRPRPACSSSARSALSTRSAWSSRKPSCRSASSASSRAIPRPPPTSAPPQTRIVDYFRNAGAPARQDPSVAPVVDHARARHGRDDRRRPGPDRAVRRGDDRTGRRLSIPRSCAPSSISSRATPIRRRRSPTRGTASARFRRSAACGSPRGRRSTPMAACPTRSMSRIACPMRSARRRNIRRPMDPPARSIGRTATCSAAPSACACRPTSSMRRHGMSRRRVSRTSRPTISAGASRRASSSRPCGARATIS